MIRALCIVVCSFMCAAAAPPAPATIAAGPAAEGQPIVIGRAFEMGSALLGDRRRINVYLPEHYGDAGRSFPVLYLLDGGEKEDFHHITGLAQINAAYGQGQELIVVGIEGKDRRHDLTSPSDRPADRKLLPTSGGAAAYRRFLVEELRPWVDGHFRTNGHNAIIGESLAGLFVADTFLAAPTAFDDYIAVSPSLWWNGGALAKDASAGLQRGGFAGRRLWVAFDTPAPPASEAAKELGLQQVFESAFLTAKPEGLQWRVLRPGESHGSIYHPAAMGAFRSLYGPTAGH